MCDDFVELPFESIVWEPRTRVVSDGEEKFIHIEYGWDVGLSEEQKAKLADDAPRGVAVLCVDAEIALRLASALISHAADIMGDPKQ